MRTTRSAVTERRSKRTAIDAQPLPRLNPLTAKEKKLLNLSDASIAVQWLNTAKDAKATRSYQRVASVRRQLEEFRSLRAILQEYGTDSRAWKKAARKQERQRALVNAGTKGLTVTFPAIDYDAPAYRRIHRRAERLHSDINEALCKYAFRPRVTYFVAGDVWRSGMVPDDNSRWFEMKIGGWTTVSEADAVLCLVRLDLTGEVGQVRLCETCRDRWRVAAKSNYRFCSSDCRSAFYAKQPNYHARKAANQRKYRRNLKLMGRMRANLRERV